MEIINLSQNKTGRFYTCDVCGKASSWTENHSRVERPIGHGYEGWEENFIICSDECQSNMKEPFVKWLGSKKGWTEASALKNYIQVFENKTNK